MPSGSWRRHDETTGSDLGLLATALVALLERGFAGRPGRRPLTSFTSRHAYAEQVVSGRATTQRERILECLKASAVPLTRRQLSELTRIPLNAVCGRVNVLVTDGLARVAFEDEDQVTHTRAQFLEAVVPGPAQRRFQWAR